MLDESDDEDVEYKGHFCSLGALFFLLVLCVKKKKKKLRFNRTRNSYIRTLFAEKGRVYSCIIDR